MEDLMEDTKYEFDISVEEYFTENNAVDKYNLLVDTLTVVEEFNSLQNLIPTTKIIDLEELETEAIDLVNEEIEEAIVITSILQFYKDRLREYLLRLGIQVSDEIYLYQLRDLFECLNTLYNLDADYVEPLVKDLESHEVATFDTFMDLIGEYAKEDYYSIVIDVQDSVLQAFEDFFNTRLEYKDLDLPDDLETDLAVILRKDGFFGLTIFYNQILQKQATTTTVVNILPKLYAILEKHKKEEHLIAYEIYLAFLIAGVSRAKIFDTFQDEVDLSLVSYIGEDQYLINTLTRSVESLCKNMLGDVSHEEE